MYWLENCYLEGGSNLGEWGGRRVKVWLTGGAGRGGRGQSTGRIFPGKESMSKFSATNRCKIFLEINFVKKIFSGFPDIPENQKICRHEEEEGETGNRNA